MLSPYFPMWGELTFVAGSGAVFTFSPKRKSHLHDALGMAWDPSSHSGEGDSLEAESASIPLCSWFFIAELSGQMVCSENRRVDIGT